MKVTKFGGSSLASAAQMRKVADIVSADPERRLVVVSAPGRRNRKDVKVTDLLIEAARARLTRGDASNEISAVVQRFATIVRGLRLPSALIDALRDDLGTRIEADASDEEAYLDGVKALGEDQCARLLASLLRQRGVDAHYVSPGDAGMLLSDEPGNARVLQQSYGRLRALRERDGVVVFPGYFGYTPGGRLVTFPRGGSDISGAILAAATDAEVYENFTDTDGVYAADPHLVSRPHAVRQITFREMRELSYAGFSVFHDEALEPVFHAGIPVNVRNTNNPGAPGTLIVPERDHTEMPIVGIAGMTGFCAVYVARYLMNREVGFGRRLLGIFEDEGVPFEHLPTGIDNMSVVARETYFDHATEERVVRRVRHELDADEVRVERDLALVMVVGEGMQHQIGTAARACGAIARAGINLEMINQGSSEISMMFGIKRHALRGAVKSLYRELMVKRRRSPRKAGATGSRRGP